MTLLTFTPRTSAEAQRMIEKLDQSDYHADWNESAGCFEFEEDEQSVDELEFLLSQEITNDIFGHFETVKPSLNGRCVKIDPLLTTDPHDRRGQKGNVIEHVGHILKVRFDDGSSGMYHYDTVLLLEAAN